MSSQFDNMAGFLLSSNSQETWYLDEPAHIVGVDLMLDCPLGQFVPLVSGAAVDWQPEFHVLVLALLQVGHHLLRSRGTKRPPEGAKAQRVCRAQKQLHCTLCKIQAIECCSVCAFSEHLNNVTKVFPLNEVVRFDEDLSQDGLTDGIVFGVELVESMESVTILQSKGEILSHGHSTSEKFCFKSPSRAVLTACMSSVSTLRSKAVRFMLSNTSMSVWPLPLSMCTMSLGYFFMALLIKRRRCFWFMQEDAWMCVSTCRTIRHKCRIP